MADNIIYLSRVRKTNSPGRKPDKDGAATFHCRHLTKAEQAAVLGGGPMPPEFIEAIEYGIDVPAGAVEALALSRAAGITPIAGNSPAGRRTRWIS